MIKVRSTTEKMRMVYKGRTSEKEEYNKTGTVWKAHEKCHRTFGKVGSCEYSGGAVVPESAPATPADTAPSAGTGPASTSSVI